MNRRRIDAALAHATETHAVVIGAGVLSQVGSLLFQHFPGRTALVVADTVTFDVAGRSVMDSLAAAGIATEAPFIFPGRPILEATYDHAVHLRAVLTATDAIAVAVGSGTINDLTKLASHLAGRQYLAVATAASMDGYAASGAPLKRDGFKETFSCPAPRAIVADVEILAAAPARLTAAGYGDLIGKVTAGADWILADALGVEPIRPEAWALVQPPLRSWLDAPERLAAHDPAAADGLIEGLVMTGLAIQSDRTSRPASGSEHQFSHLWEMQHLEHAGEPVSHGFGVAMGTLAVTALYDWLMRQDLGTLEVGACCGAWPTAAEVERSVRATHPHPTIAEKAVQLTLAKHLSREQLAARLEHVRAVWPDLRARLQAQLIPLHQLKAMLFAAGCPVAPEQIGLTQARLRASYEAARQIRSRYTVLDFALQTGLARAALDAISI